jgi:VCBS repeat-containing protein
VSMSEDGSPNPFSLTLHATDADAGDTLTWSLLTPAAHGTAVAAGMGAELAVQYTPDANYHGADSFEVQVSDGNGGTDKITVNVVISPVNDAPEITEGAAITVTMSQDGTPVPFSLTLHATDVDQGDTLTWTVSQTATHGAASVAATGAVGYVPEAGYSGTDSFEVTVSDGNGGTDTILVNVIIVAAPIEDEAKLYIPVVVKAQ